MNAAYRISRVVVPLALIATLALLAADVSAGCGSCGKGHDGETAKAKVEKSGGICTAGACPVAAKTKTCPAAKAAKTCHAEHHKHAQTAAATIDTGVLCTLIRSNVPVTILDARAGKYDDGRRLPGAKAVKPDADKKTLARLIPGKDSLIVTYCGGVTCPLSSQLADRLTKLGYRHVLEYPQGISGWTEAGHDVRKVDRTAAE
ncbi:MAG: rhodanese-like domain-containing protein [Phycisphaerae bacterium]